MPASVRKAAQVLDLFSVQRPDWGPTEVADELKIAKSTAHALLRELASVGLTERLPCGRYRLGWRTLGLARTMLATNGHLDMITPTARRLANHFGETVHITAWQRGRVLYVATERPPRGVAAPTKPVVAELTPPGRVLLAERAGDTGNPAEVQRLRRRGYAVGPQRALVRTWTAPPPPCARATARQRLPWRSAPHGTGSGRGATSTPAPSPAPACGSRDPCGDSHRSCGLRPRLRGRDSRRSAIANAAWLRATTRDMIASHRPSGPLTRLSEEAWCASLWLEAPEPSAEPWWSCCRLGMTSSWLGGGPATSTWTSPLKTP